jgi:hypothetical protein
MDAAVRQTIERASDRLDVLLGDAQRALRGEADFDSVTVRRMREAIGQMSDVVSRSQELRKAQPDLGPAFDHYRAQLRELQTTLQKVRVMLLARQRNLQASQAQVTAVARWANAFQQTQ